jgi:hypothetical protein
MRGLYASSGMAAQILRHDHSSLYPNTCTCTTLATSHVAEPVC